MPREGNGKARFSSIEIQPLSSSGEHLEVARPGCDLSVEIELECRAQIADCNVAIVLYEVNGYRVIDTNTAQKGEYINMSPGQKARAHFLLHDVLLKPGKYFVGVWLGRHMMETVDFIEHSATVDVMEGEETAKHGITYPGVYLCRFEQSVSVS